MEEKQPGASFEGIDLFDERPRKREFDLSGIQERDEIILSCSNLSKSYGPTVALCSVSLQLRAGGIVGLLGPNGSGKSTFIKLAMGMLQPTMGEIRIAGAKPSPESKARTAFLPDVSFLPKWMKVRQVLDYMGDFFPDFRREKAESMLSRLGIGLDQRVKALSKGNQEKVCLIVTMARDADLYILDEPIAGVDPAARDFILDVILLQKPTRSTILVCTHLIADIEPILTHAVFLNRGQVVLDRSVREIREQQGKSLDELFREVFRW